MPTRKNGARTVQTPCRAWSAPSSCWERGKVGEGPYPEDALQLLPLHLNVVVQRRLVLPRRRISKKTKKRGGRQSLGAVGAAARVARTSGPSIPPKLLASVASRIPMACWRWTSS